MTSPGMSQTSCSSLDGHKLTYMVMKSLNLSPQPYAREAHRIFCGYGMIYLFTSPLLTLQRKTGVKGDYQVVKQDQDELVAVCKVMEDLIRMHTSIFLVSYSLGVYIHNCTILLCDYSGTA